MLMFADELEYEENTADFDYPEVEEQVDNVALVPKQVQEVSEFFEELPDFEGDEVKTFPVLFRNFCSFFQFSP